MYDYWKPLPVDTLTSSQGEQEIDNLDDEEGPVMEENEEEETSDTEENEVAMISEDEEKEEGNSTLTDRKETGDETKPEELEGDNTMDDPNETEEVTELVHSELNKEMPEMETQLHRSAEEAKVMDEQIETGNRAVETENLV